MSSNVLVAGIPDTLVPGVRRLIAPNAGMMTGPGTNTYLLGKNEITVIDPGPSITSHIDKITDIAGAPVRQVLVTHTHPDHSPAAALLAASTGAELMGIAAPQGRHQDQSFVPDRELRDGETITTEEFDLHVVHTPGHASNHLCYLHEQSQLLFTGDHIINGSTVVIDPPDGSMFDYLESLRKLKELQIAAIAPGHGAIIEDVNGAIDWIIDHRLQREAKTIEKLQANPSEPLSVLVTKVYDEIDTSLHPLAERSLLAHLLKLERDGRATAAGDRWVSTGTPG